MSVGYHGRRPSLADSLSSGAITEEEVVDDDMIDAARPTRTLDVDVEVDAEARDAELSERSRADERGLSVSLLSPVAATSPSAVVSILRGGKRLPPPSRSSLLPSTLAVPSPTAVASRSTTVCTNVVL